MAKHQFVIGTTKVEIDLTDLNLAEDRAEINKALCGQPAKYGEVARCHALARAKVEELSDSIHIMEAELDSEIRDAATKSGEKLTEAKVISKIRTNERYIKLQKQMVDAGLTEKLLGTIVQSYVQRKDCVLELARNYRAELSSVGGNSA